MNAQPVQQQGPGFTGTQFSNNLGFRQEFNNYNWFDQALFMYGSNKWQVSVSEEFQSSLLKLGPENNKWKDDQRAHVMIDYLLLPKFSLFSNTASTIFIDRQSGFNNDIRTYSGLFGVSYKPTYTSEFRAAVGPKWDKRYSHQDKGTAFNLSFTGRDLEWEEYYQNLNFILDQEKYQNRQNHNITTNYFVTKEFPQGTADSLRIFSTNRRRDNYTSISGDVESWRERNTGAENLLVYKISDRSYFRLNSELSSKDVEVLSFTAEETRNRKRNDQRFSNDLGYYFDNPWLVGNVRLSHWAQTQKYDIKVEQAGLPFSKRTAFITPDNESSRLELETNLRRAITQRDTLKALFSISKFQYDTPDTSNFDDRDELRINTRLTAIHHFSAFLSMELLTSVNLYHMVYIFGERSADNNWNRIFRLKPKINYRPTKRFTFKQSFEVLANYVDYDFESNASVTKSFVFRKFSVDDTLKYRVFDDASILIDYKLQLEENGQLSWDNWTERVLVTRKKQWMHLFWRYEKLNNFIISPGYTLYWRDEWRHKTNPDGLEIIDPVGTFTSHGPMIRFRYNPAPWSMILVDATRYKVNGPEQKEYYMNNVKFSVRWNF